MSLVGVAQVDRVPEGTMKAVSVQGVPVLIVKVEGEFYALSDKCTHYSGDLSQGKLKGIIVTCPRHGAQFDVTTGSQIKGPGDESVSVYKVKVEGKSIKVDIYG